MDEAELSFSKLCLGTEIYSRKDDFISLNEIKNIFSLSLDSGINFIDCAECYGDHLSESIVGETIFRNRNNWILASKFGHENKDNITINRFDLNSIKIQFENSLKSLKTDYIDIYYFHSGNNSDFFNDDLWKYLNNQVDLGKIRYLGLSIKHDLVKKGNLEQIIKAQDYNIKYVQTVYNYLNRDSEKLLFNLCMKNKISIITRMPLAKGMLSGKYESNNDFKFNDSRLMYYEENKINFEKIKKELSHIPKNMLPSWAINWVLKKNYIKSAVVAFRSAKQLANVIKNIN
ncbi:aldo/keto reductase [Pelagibacteraceae bacterium]|nr:aldo/keto reductase [Pelagibacteraceae bacterium]